MQTVVLVNNYIGGGVVRESNFGLAVRIKLLKIGKIAELVDRRV